LIYNTNIDIAADDKCIMGNLVISEYVADVIIHNHYHGD